KTFRTVPFFSRVFMQDPSLVLYSFIIAYLFVGIVYKNTGTNLGKTTGSLAWAGSARLSNF
ncbi:MAG: hypothetical protein J5723_05820, partial [Ruminococcus sp.]|nr:hypothetical protein [Ruminococcus sp.]